jgi:hypothetical protein
VDGRMKKKKNRIEVNCWLCFVRMPIEGKGGHRANKG